MQSGDEPKRGIGDPVDGFKEFRGERGRWKKRPSSSTPRGRPRDARNKVDKRFIEDVLALWQEQGLAILRRAALEDPMRFAEMLARLLPRHLDLRDTTFEDQEQERTADLIEALELQMGRGP